MRNLSGKLFSVSCIVVSVGLLNADAVAEELSMIDYCMNKLANEEADTAFCSGYLKGHEDGYKKGTAFIGYAADVGDLGRLIGGSKSETTGKEIPFLLVVPGQTLDLSNATGNGVFQQLQQQLNPGPAQ